MTHTLSPLPHHPKPTAETTGPRPRERLLTRGPQSLADTELFALLLGSGCSGKPSMTLAAELLAHYGGIAQVLAAPWESLRQVRGVGPSKFALFQATRELSKRACESVISERPLINHRQAVDDFLVTHLSSLPHEVFAVLFLDTQRRLIRFEQVFQGSLTQTSVYPREIARRCLQLHAAAVIVAHNHPSGVAEPSTADRLLTTQLRRSLAGLEIELLDHLVVAGNRTISVEAAN
jgi:DNA repair protein RadC